MFTRRLRFHAQFGCGVLVLATIAWFAARVTRVRLLLPTARHEAPAAVHVPSARSGPGDPLRGARDLAPRLGGRRMRGVVGAHGVDEWTLRFAGRHPASIEVYGGGGSRLHCVVHDAAGTVVDTDTSAITGCLLYLVPPRTGAYRVVIRNRGGVSSAYWLVTN